MTAVIRRAEASDAEALIGLIDALSAFVEDPPTRLTAEDLRNDGFGPDAWFHCFVAEQGGRRYDDVFEMTLKGGALEALARRAPE